jgi:hypothetical protein
MKNINFLIAVVLLLASCVKKSDSETLGQEMAIESANLNDLDSNYVLENVAKLSTFKAIEDKFGAKNILKDSTISGSDSTKLEVSILYPNTVNEATIFWKKNQKHQLLESVVVACDSAGYKGKWHSEKGLQPSQNLATVLAINKKPFTISGFGWQYGGHVVSWEGGSLDTKMVTGRFADYGKNKISASEFKSITGPTEFNISLEAIKNLNPILNELTVFGR